ncbi:MAG: YCF48-related protein, partial [bacterium]
TSLSSGTSNDLRSVFFVGANLGVVAGQGGVILRTIDGGKSWATVMNDPSVDLFDIYFADANMGAAVGSQGAVLRTTDGGESWTKQNSGVSNDLFAVFFSDANTGTAVGSLGTVLRTHDAGTTWQLQSASISDDLYDVYFVNSTTGIAAGGNPSDPLLGGTILYTTDGGANWKARESGTMNDLYGIAFPASNVGFVVGLAGTILYTQAPIAYFEEPKPNGQPAVYTLFQNYPNPFRVNSPSASATIGYRLSIPAAVRLEIYNILGQRVQTLVNRNQLAGIYIVQWDGIGETGQLSASGIYFYRMEVQNVVQTQKLLLVR